VLLALAAVVAVVTFFASRDQATTATAVPGEAGTDPPAYAADLRRGSIVLEVGTADERAGALALARDIAGAGAGGAAARAAGQAVLVRVPPPGLGVSTPECTDDEGRALPCRFITAYAHGRHLRAFQAGDPALRAFVEYWLGRG
jgi:hypothetical protein